MYYNSYDRNYNYYCATLLLQHTCSLGLTHSKIRTQELFSTRTRRIENFSLYIFFLREIVEQFMDFVRIIASELLSYCLCVSMLIQRGKKNIKGSIEIIIIDTLSSFFVIFGRIRFLKLVFRRVFVSLFSYLIHNVDR